MRRASRLTATLTLTLILLLAPQSSWAAGPTDTSMQERVDDVIEDFGGSQTSWNEVTWGEGAIVLTLDPTDTAPDSTPRAATAREASAKCASGRYCVYSAAGFRGNKLSYATCPATYTSFAALHGKVRSVKNSRSSGTVLAYAGSQVKATVKAGRGASSVSRITKIRCS